MQACCHHLNISQSRHKHQSFAHISDARSICTKGTKTQQLGIGMNHESYSSKIFFIFPMYIWGAKQYQHSSMYFLFSGLLKQRVPKNLVVKERFKNLKFMPLDFIFSHYTSFIVFCHSQRDMRLRLFLQANLN